MRRAWPTWLVPNWISIPLLCCSWCCGHDTCVQYQSVESLLLARELSPCLLDGGQRGEVALYEGNRWAIGHGRFDMFDGFESFRLSARREVNMCGVVLRELQARFLSKSNVAFADMSETGLQIEAEEKTHRRL